MTALLDDLPVTLLFVVVVMSLTVSVTLGIVIALARRRRKEAQEIVRHLEEMRSGRMRTRLDLDPRSPFAPIAESTNRLGQDLALRWSRADAASDGFQALQDAARGYGVVATDGDGDIRSYSAGAAQLFGWEEDAVVGRNASLLFDDASWKDLLPKLARKSLRERGVDTRAVMARQDGARFHARLFVRVLRGHGDETSGFLLVVQDVSDRVRVEGELRAAESRSRGILEELPSGVALVVQGRIAYANAAMRALLDVGEPEAVGLALRDRIATTQVILVQDALARLEAPAASPVEARVTLLDANGRAAREARLVGLPYVHEGRAGALVLLRDESSEMRLARALAADEARLSAVLDAWDDAIVLIEEDDAATARVRLANRAFVSLFGLVRADVLGAAESDLLRTLRGRGEDGIAAAAVLAASAGGPASDQIGSDTRTLALWAAPIVDPTHRLRMLAVRDVTSQQARLRAQAEDGAGWRRRHAAAEAAYAELRALHEEVTGRKAEADKLNAELRTLDGMKSDLLANVSHELQTPLVSIRGYTEMILKGRLGAINDEQRKGLSLSLKNIDRLIAMIDNLLAFARADRSSGAMTLTSFPLLAVVDEALAVLAPRIEAKALRVTRRFDDREMAVRADRDKILQVFLNLIGNAVKFSRERGTIEIAASRAKPGVAVVQVRDTGIGIAKDEIEKIFDRFHQAGVAATAEKEGTGIGLAIVRNILSLHGGSVHATSELGRGTVLSFTLPLAEEKPEAPEAPAPEERPADTRPRLRIIRRG